MSQYENWNHCQLCFFAVDQDIHPILDALSNAEAIKFSLKGLFANPEATTWVDWSNLPKLSHAIEPQSVRGLTYLISHLEDILVAEPIRQFDGTMMYAFDQQRNPATITFRPGGRFDTGIIIAGSFATCSRNVQSASLMRTIQRIIRKNFRKVNAYWLGNSAFVEFEAGSRLTASIDSPIEYDLRKI